MKGSSSRKKQDLNAVKTILVIERDHDTRVALRKTLEEAGFYVFSSANGVDGLALLLRIKPPDLILLDWALPLMGGLDFLKVKNQSESCASVRVLALSDVPMSKPEGVQVVVTKPLQMSDLMKTIKAFCPPTP